MPNEAKPNRRLATILDVVGGVLFTTGGLALVIGPMFHFLDRIVTSNVVEFTAQDIVLGLLALATMTIGVKACDKAQDIRQTSQDSS